MNGNDKLKRADKISIIEKEHDSIVEAYGMMD